MHTHVAISTPNQSDIFKLGGLDSISHIDAAGSGFSTLFPTLAMSNLVKWTPATAARPNVTYTDSSFVAQVTTNEVLLFDFDQALGIPIACGESWSPKKTKDWQNKRIVAASINASQILLALSGGILVLLKVDERDQLQLKAYVYTPLASVLELTLSACHQFQRIWM